MKDRVLLLSALLTLWLLGGFALAHSHCTPEKCDDENVKSLLGFSRTTANISSLFRLRSLDASPTEDGKSNCEFTTFQTGQGFISIFIIVATTHSIRRSTRINTVNLRITAA